MTRIRPRHATALAALLLLSIAACNNSDATPPPTPPPTTESSTPITPPPSPTPTPTPRPKPPAIPPAATSGLTITAAESFARFYLSAIDYAAGTGDTRLMHQWAEKVCLSCQVLENLYERRYRDGGSVTGDFRFRIQRMSEVRLIGTNTAAVVVEGRYGRHVVVERTGAKPKVLAGGKATWDITLAAQGSHWVMYTMVRK